MPCCKSSSRHLQRLPVKKRQAEAEKKISLSESYLFSVDKSSLTLSGLLNSTYVMYKDFLKFQRETYVHKWVKHCWNDSCISMFCVVCETRTDVGAKHTFLTKLDVKRKVRNVRLWIMNAWCCKLFVFVEYVINFLNNMPWVALDAAIVFIACSGVSLWFVSTDPAPWARPSVYRHV